MSDSKPDDMSYLEFAKGLADQRGDLGPVVEELFNDAKEQGASDEEAFTHAMIESGLFDDVDWSDFDSGEGVVDSDDSGEDIAF